MVKSEFKKLLTEVFTEVLRKELPKLLSENVNPEKSQTPTPEVLQEFERKKMAHRMDFLEGFKPQTVIGELLAETVVRPESEYTEPGVDISNLSFVKNAAAIFEKSNNITK